VVQKAGAVATKAAVDHTSVRQAEYERVASLRALTNGGVPVDQFCLVLDGPLACGERL
jgi:hypothetical protein